MNTLSNNGTFKSLFDSLFDNSLSDFVGSDYTTNIPAVNISESEEAFAIDVAAPGLDKQDFEVTIDKDQLVLKANHQKEDDSNEFRRREFNYSIFTRRFTIPKNVDRDSISATYELGVLRINLTKDFKPEEGIKKIDIQ